MFVVNFVSPKLATYQVLIKLKLICMFNLVKFMICGFVFGFYVLTTFSLVGFESAAGYGFVMPSAIQLAKMVDRMK